MSAHPPVPQRVAEAVEAYREAVDDQATNYASFSIQRHHHRAVDEAHRELLAAIADAIEQARRESHKAVQAFAYQMDETMKGASTYERGQKIARLISELEDATL